MPDQIFYTLSTAQDNTGSVISPPDPTVLPTGQPGPSTHIYDGAIVIGQPTKIRAMTVRNPNRYSTVNAVYYSLETPPPEETLPVSYNPGSKEGPAGQQFDVAMASATSGAVIWYCTAANSIIDPLDSNGLPQNGASSITNGAAITVTIPTIVTARAIAPGKLRSTMTVARYTEDNPPLQCAPVAFNPAGGQAPAGDPLTVVMTCPTPGSTIYYTDTPASVLDPLDGNGSPIVEAVSGSGVQTVYNGVYPRVLNARAVAPGMLPSNLTSAFFYIHIS